jgi:hypothetical protein
MISRCWRGHRSFLSVQSPINHITIRETLAYKLSLKEAPRSDSSTLAFSNGRSLKQTLRKEFLTFWHSKTYDYLGDLESPCEKVRTWKSIRFGKNLRFFLGSTNSKGWDRIKYKNIPAVRKSSAKKSRSDKYRKCDSEIFHCGTREFSSFYWDCLLYSLS